MQIFVVALVTLLAYLGTMSGFWFWLKSRTPKDIEHNLEATIGGVIVSVLILSLGAILTVFPQVSLRQYALLIAVLMSLLYAQNKWPRLEYKFFWTMFLALFGTALAAEILPGLPVSLDNQVAMTLTWFVVMNAVIWFDREPLVSFLTAASWALAFSLICLTPNMFPAQLAILMVLTVAVLWGMLNMMAKYLSRVSLGPYGSTVLGFIMGGVIAVFVGYGSVASAITLCSYYLFELVFIGLTYCGFHPLRMQKGDFVLNRCLIEAKSAGLIRILGIHLICLALLGALLWRTPWIGALLIVTLVMLVDLYNRYHGLGRPVPGFRDMWHETQNMVKAALQRTKFNSRSTQPVKASEPAVESAKEIKSAKKSKPLAKSKATAKPKFAAKSKVVAEVKPAVKTKASVKPKMSSKKKTIGKKKK